MKDKLEIINIKRITIYRDKSFLLRFEIGELNGLWEYGYTIEYVGQSGSSCGIWFNENSKRSQFTSREEAVWDGITYMIEYLKSHGDHPNGRSNKAPIKKLTEFVNNQHELFA
jgi:hypothetical protein